MSHAAGLIAGKKRNCYSMSMQLPTPFHSRHNIAVVFACDNRFLPYCAVAVASLLTQAQQPNYYDILILHEETLSQTTTAKFQQLCQGKTNASLRFVNVTTMAESWIKQMSLRENTSLSAYYRLLIPDLLAHYDKIIYLDCDVLLLKDIALLYQLPLPEGKLMAAVPDALAYSSNPARQDFFTRHTRRLGLDSPFEYFNSGVLLWDLKRHRQQNMQPILQQCREKFRHAPHMDQDILNAAFYGKIYFLPLAFNFFPRPPAENAPSLPSSWQKYLQSRTQASQAPVIIHYAGIEKPWFYPNMPYGKSWWESAVQTPFLPELTAARRCHEQTMRRHFRRRWWYWLIQWGYRIKNKLQAGRGTAGRQAFALQERIRICTFWREQHEKKQ